MANVPLDFSPLRSSLVLNTGAGVPAKALCAVKVRPHTTGALGADGAGGPREAILYKSAMVRINRSLCPPPQTKSHIKDMLVTRDSSTEPRREHTARYAGHWRGGKGEVLQHGQAPLIAALYVRWKFRALRNNNCYLP
jgi:hypothetical protein